MGGMGLRINWMDSVNHAIEVIKPDSWKGYTVGDPLQNACMQNVPGTVLCVFLLTAVFQLRTKWCPAPLIGTFDLETRQTVPRVPFFCHHPLNAPFAHLT